MEKIVNAAKPVVPLRVLTLEEYNKLVPFRPKFKDVVKNVSCLDGDRLELFKMNMENFKVSPSSNFEGILYSRSKGRWLD